MVDQPLTPRVLVVTASFPPDAAVGTLRTLRLIRHATDSDWSVDVLTIAAETYRQGTVTDAGMLSKVPEGVRVIRARALRPAERLLARLRGRREARGPMNAASSAPAENRPRTATWNGGVIRKVKEAGSAMLALPDREVSWLLPAVIRACQATRGARPDVIYSSGPPFTAHLVAAVLSVVFRRPWVADFRDPWARAPWREDRFGFERQAWGLFERLVVSRAHTTVFVTRTNAREFAAHYGEKIARRFRVVANGCDPSDFEGLRGRADGNRFVLLHAGSLYGARNPAPLFRAVAAAIARGSIAPDRLRIRFIGRLGIAGFAMTALLRDLGLSAIVEFVPHMPRRDVLQEMLNASALLIVQPVTRVSVPGKLYEYLAAGRPILGLADPDGETAEIIRNSPAGVTVCAEDPVAIEQGLLELMASSQRPVMAASRDTYDGVARAAELEELLLQAAASRGSRIPRLRQVGLATEHAAQETRRS